MILTVENRSNVSVQRTSTLDCLTSPVLELGPLPENITWS